MVTIIIRAFRSYIWSFYFFWGLISLFFARVLQIKVLVCFCLLGAGRAVNVLVPYFYKIIGTVSKIPFSMLGVLLQMLCCILNQLVASSTRIIVLWVAGKSCSGSFLIVTIIITISIIILLIASAFLPLLGKFTTNLWTHLTLPTKWTYPLTSQVSFNTKRVTYFSVVISELSLNVIILQFISTVSEYYLLKKN